MADLHNLRRLLKAWGYKLTALHSEDAYRILNKAKAPQKFGPDGRTVLTLAEVDEFVESVQSVRNATDVQVPTRNFMRGSTGLRSFRGTGGRHDRIEDVFIKKIDIDT